MADYTDGEHGIWLVVPPSIGLPLLLGTVALIAILVHAALIGHTKWYPKYWEGSNKVVSTEPAATAPAVR
jgi:light-harvesting protein B-800-850 alpha chain